MRIAKRIAAFLISFAARCAAPLLWRQTARSEQPLRIIIGAGRHGEPGWISTDILPRSRRVLYLDVRKPFPLRSNSVDAYLCEHMIEHIRYEDALSMLQEIRRTLKPGATVRLSTPDLAKICGLMVKTDACYVRAANEGWARYYRPGSTSPIVHDLDNPAFTVNRNFREWNHVFLWDERTLGAALEECGFAWERSELSELEHHADEIGDFINRWESLVIEARSV